MEAKLRISRIGRAPISIPSGVSAEVSQNVVSVKGKLGELKQEIHKDVSVNIENGVISVSVVGDNQALRALHGLSRALINNMVIGVSSGYEKKLNLVGVGYRASIVGKALKLEVGKSHEVLMDLPAGITCEVNKKQDEIILRGSNKQVLGQFVADVISQRPVEPYKGKGIRYAGQLIKLKAGKKAGRK